MVGKKSLWIRKKTKGRRVLGTYLIIQVFYLLIG
ncbi:hypothetical protein JTE87_04349 [Bacillus amyloliquefaciens]|nr:hypothetical protein [Bacillus subtilis]MCB5337345.1 hypothetical protein [Bacillus amyloliquefaciens]